tara:strand:- start:31 stop:1953 length:1923 start_codon:yes stop_codon:yes gene_type:complete
MKVGKTSIYKAHRPVMTAHDVIMKKKEKAINESDAVKDKRQTKEISVKNNEIVSVKNYEMYNTLTKPKYINIFESIIYRGHNSYKIYNAVGGLYDRTKIESDFCDPSFQELHALSDQSRYLTFLEMVNWSDDTIAAIMASIAAGQTEQPARVINNSIANATINVTLLLTGEILHTTTSDSEGRFVMDFNPLSVGLLKFAFSISAVGGVQNSVAINNNTITLTNNISMFHFETYDINVTTDRSQIILTPLSSLSVASLFSKTVGDFVSAKYPIQYASLSTNSFMTKLFPITNVELSTLQNLLGLSSIVSIHSTYADFIETEKEASIAKVTTQLGIDKQLLFSNPYDNPEMQKTHTFITATSKLLATNNEFSDSGNTLDSMREIFTSFNNNIESLADTTEAREQFITNTFSDISVSNENLINLAKETSRELSTGDSALILASLNVQLDSSVATSLDDIDAIDINTVLDATLTMSVTIPTDVITLIIDPDAELVPYNVITNDSINCYPVLDSSGFVMDYIIWVSSTDDETPAYYDPAIPKNSSLIVDQLGVYTVNIINNYTQGNYGDDLSYNYLTLSDASGNVGTTENIELLSIAGTSELSTIDQVSYFKNGFKLVISGEYETLYFKNPTTTVSSKTISFTDE